MSTRRLSVGRALAFPLAAAALLTSFSGVAAAPALRQTIHQVHLSGDLSLEGAYVSFQLTASEGGDDGVNIMIWLAPDSPIFDPPTLVGASADLHLGADDSSMFGTVDLARPDSGEAAGTATLDADLAPNGPAELITNRLGGNHKVFTEQTIQPLAVSGSLIVPSDSGQLTFLLDDASAVAIDHVEFANAPSSTVTSTKALGMLQYWQVDGMAIGVRGEADSGISYIEVAVFLPDGGVLHGSDEDAVLTHQAIDAVVPMAFEGQGTAATGGTVTVTGTVSKGDVTREVTVDGDDRILTTVQHYLMAGSLTISLDDGREYTLDLAAGDGPFYGFVQRTRDGGAAG